MIKSVALLLLSVAVFVAAALWSAARLPLEGVAVHVDSHGAVNGYASRAQVIALYVTLGGVVAGLAVAVLVAARWLPVRLMNVPHKDHWSQEQRLPLLRRMLVRDVAVLFGLALLGCSCLPVEITRLTLDPAGHNQVWLPLVGGALMLTLFAYIAWMVIARYRPGADR
ncbi:MAG TPA: hypothetical protein VIQ30_24995 [Pseudonocardia sp.]